MGRLRNIKPRESRAKREILESMHCPCLPVLMKGKAKNHPSTDLKDHHQISIVKHLAVTIAMISIPMGYWREVGERTLDQIQVFALD